jgi:pyruvate dehydrogenase kinase 2/3/4
MPSVVVATPTTPSFEENSLKDLVSEYISNQPSPLTMQQLTNFGRMASQRTASDHSFLLQSFNFLRKEMPTRLATTMQEIDHLPVQLVDTQAVTTVKNWFVHSDI